MIFSTPFKTLAFSCAIAVAAQANAKEFSYLETFDEPAFSGSAALPDGWASVSTFPASPMMRYAGSYIGSGAHSGSSVLGTLQTSSFGRDDYAFSKAISLKGGVEYTVSFWVKMPGGSAAPFNNNVKLMVGTAQTKEAMTTTLGETTATKIADWEQKTYKFTPDSDGDYYFGFNIITAMYMSSYVAIDDFQITGEETETGGGETGGGETGGTETEETVDLFKIDFDNDADFANGAKVPEGWTSTGTVPFQRNKGSYYGLGSHSGDYILGTNPSPSYGRDERVYTKLYSLKAGQEYKLSFWYKAPGGNNAQYYYTQVTTWVGTAQSAEGMTTKLGSTPAQTTYPDWTELSYTFTPEADGDYCFGFSFDTMLNNSGSVGLDDIELSTTKKGGSTGEEDDREAVDLPYSQSFDNENKDYDGKHYVPNGWLSTGTMPFVTAYTDAMPAKDGSYYLIANESTSARDERLYSPYFTMEAGKTYTASFYLYMPGDEENSSDLTLTIGTQQNAEAQTTELLSLPAYTNKAWKKYEVTFTPEKTDKYSLCFALGGETAVAGEVCIDLFRVTAPGLIAKPRAQFGVNGSYNVMNSSVLTSADCHIQMINGSTDADSYEWTAEGATPSTSTEYQPTFSFPESGDYKIKLKATNVKGEDTMEQTFKIQVLDKNTTGQISVENYSPNDTQLQRETAPAYDTDANGYDYVTGFNHYYEKIAEKFNVPDGFEYTLGTINYGLNFYNISNNPNVHDGDKPFSIVLYGDKNGRPDPDNVYDRWDTTVREALGTTGNSTLEFRTIKPTKQLVAKGTFYLAFEFDGMSIDEADSHLTRSFISLSAYKHKSNISSLFVLPTAAPEGSAVKVDGTWTPVESYDMDLKGMGISCIAWMTPSASGATAVAVTPDGKVAFAAMLNGNDLTVSGTKAGETVSVFDMAGRNVAQKAAADQSTVVSLAGVPAGVYIVTTPAGTQKFVKK